MTSYFEKLTSINASSLKGGTGANSADLSSALEKIEELKTLNCKLEVDLKCEHDEKADLVGLKVGLENEVLNLREINERLEFQVEQLRVEKDKIHHVLAKVREEGGGSTGGERASGLFIASSGGLGVMKKFPSMDDLSCSSTTSPLFTSPSSSPTHGLPRVVTPTSMASGGPLERITEEDETLLESLVLSNNKNEHIQPSSSTNLQPQQQTPRVTDLMKKIAFLESENVRLTRKKFVCSKCKRRSSGRRNPVIFEDEGLVLSAVDDDDDEDLEEEDEEDDGFDDDGAVGGVGAPVRPSGIVKSQANSILEMQRKIIAKLERELNTLGEGNNDNDADNPERREILKMKRELERRMSGIVWIIANNNNNEEGELGENENQPSQQRRD